MSMFDHYRPASEKRCPVCSRVLRRWQGKDGPNGLFLWAEGTRSPVEQAVDEESQIDRGTRGRLALPARFIIYSLDRPEHQPIEAECRAPEGTWIETAVRPFLPHVD